MKSFRFARQKSKSSTSIFGPHRLSLLILLCVIAGLLVACGGGGSSSEPATPSEEAPSSQADSQATNEEESSSSTVEEDEEEEEEEATPAENTEGNVLPGAEEFGMTQEELVESIEVVEGLIATCMSEAGFEYVPVDYLTVREAMNSDKKAAGLTDEEYRSTYGYGISTRLKVKDGPPQAGSPDSIFRLGLGEQNVQIYNNLSATDQDAYNHTLFGENTNATFAFSLEDEDFSETGGCTRTAIEQYFSPEQLSASYRNPGDALIQQDARVIEAIVDWSDCMREEGFDYNNPEEVEKDIESQLEGILNGADPNNLSSDAQAALTELQGAETTIALKDLDCEEEFIEPVVKQVETELYGAPQN